MNTPSADDGTAGRPAVDGDRREFETPAGLAWADLRLPARRPMAVVALGHGAGGSVNAPDINAASRACVTAGFAVVAITQPYRVAGKRGAAPAPRLDEAWASVLRQLRDEPALRGARRARVPLIVGGRSSGARVACRTASAVGAAGVICLAFPLYPPGRPDRSRQPELDGAGVPVLVVQGARDPFGVPASDEPLSRRVELIDGADHGLKRETPRIGQLCAEFVAGLLG
jgi:predicted alpha/beta-hydrolase family hydrolase